MCYRIRLPSNGEILLPSNIETTDDIYKFLQDNIKTKNSLILTYNSISIPRDATINLTAIGYDQGQKFMLQSFTQKIALFKIEKYQFHIKKIIYSYQTVFDIKVFFAEEFKTVAQNIIIKHFTKILSDDQNIYDIDNVFEIDLIDGYSLFHIYFTNFSFICLQTNSTFKNLKISLASYFSLFENKIQYGPKLYDIFNELSNPDDHKIEEFSNKVPFLDFLYNNNDTLNNNQNQITINIKNANNEVVYHSIEILPFFESQQRQKFDYNIEVIKCILERKTKIDRNDLIFFSYNKNDRLYEFTVTKKLYVIVNQNIEQFCYLTTIEEIKKKYGINKGNAGIVINGLFASNDSDFIIKYLGNPFNSKSIPLSIVIITPSNISNVDAGKMKCSTSSEEKNATKSTKIKSKNHVNIRKFKPKIVYIDELKNNSNNKEVKRSNNNSNNGDNDNNNNDNNNDSNNENNNNNDNNNNDNSNYDNSNDDNSNNDNSNNDNNNDNNNDSNNDNNNNDNNNNDNNNDNNNNDNDDAKISRTEKSGSLAKSQNFCIDDNDEEFLNIIEFVGEGSTAKTFKVVDIRTNKIMCKKVIQKKHNSGFKDAKNALKEFEILYYINHPCICKSIAINIAEKAKNELNNEYSTISLFLEFLDHNSRDYLEENKDDYTMKTKIVIEIAHAMSHIAKKGLIHRDLKIDNIMLDNNLNAKVVDFGFAKITENFINDFSFTEESLTKGVGTLEFMSPEIENGDDYDYKTDVYSFGIVVYYIFVGSLPQQKRRDKFMGKPIPLPKESDSISKFCLCLISKCTSYKPVDRPSFDEIIQMIRDNSYSLASNIDVKMISQRDFELEMLERNYAINLETEEGIHTFNLIKAFFMLTRKICSPQLIEEYKMKLNNALKQVFSLINANDWKKEDLKMENAEIYTRKDSSSPLLQFKCFMIVDIPFDSYKVYIKKKYRDYEPIEKLEIDLCEFIDDDSRIEGFLFWLTKKQIFFVSQREVLGYFKMVTIGTKLILIFTSVENDDFQVQKNHVRQNIYFTAVIYEIYNINKTKITIIEYLNPCGSYPIRLFNSLYSYAIQYELGLLKNKIEEKWKKSNNQ